MFTDPQRRTYRAAGFHRGLLRVLSPAAAVAALRARRAGHRQKKTQGDALQLGGAVVLDRRGRVRWEYASETAVVPA